MDRIAGTLATLLRHVVDYAGLFPPAQLPLAEAARLYGEYRRGPRAWMLGAFVCPAAKLGELARHVPEGEVWPVSVLAQEPFEVPARLECDWVEAKAADAESIDALRLHFDRLYVETPPDDPSLLPVLRECGARAKIRTGGDTVPDSATLARFIEAAVNNRLPYKATAGLHHPIRTDAMHGFLNVLTASALAQKMFLRTHELVAALEERDPHAFRFAEDEMVWREYRITTGEAELTRSQAFTSFGSCSFDEPVQDLQALGLL